MLAENVIKILYHLNKNILNYICIKLNNAEIYIEPRPKYCDRGRFIVKAYSTNPVVCDIDEQDGFPRYYYNSTSLIIEIEAFMSAKDLKINSIDYEGYKNDGPENQGSMACGKDSHGNQDGT